MAFPHTEPAPIADLILKDPGGHYDTPMAVVRDPRLDFEARVRALDTWLDHERLLFRADRDADHVARIRQIERALLTLQAMRCGEGRTGRAA